MKMLLALLVATLPIFHACGAEAQRQASGYPVIKEGDECPEGWTCIRRGSAMAWSNTFSGVAAPGPGVVADDDTSDDACVKAAESGGGCYYWNGERWPPRPPDPLKPVIDRGPHGDECLVNYLGEAINAPQTWCDFPPDSHTMVFTRNIYIITDPHLSR